MKPKILARTAGLSIACACAFLSACKSGGKSGAIPGEAAATEAMPGDAFLVLPGDYSQKTTVEDLELRFGKSNVRREIEPEPRIILFPDDPTRRACVTFHEAAAFRELADISITDPGSRWRGKQGLQIGMTLAKLRELNGKPFYYDGFDVRHRGQVHDGWSPSLGDEDASLGMFDVGENDHLYFDVELGEIDSSRLKVAAGLPADEHLSSDDPRFPHLGERIVVTGFGASSSLDDEWE